MKLAASYFVVAVICGALPGHAAAPAGRYVVSADTVLDTRTNLTWQRAVSTTTYTLAQAQTYCSGLVLGGPGVWRVPTVRELTSLVDRRAFNPAIDSASFPATPAAPYWTATTYVPNPSVVWIVNFTMGSTYNTISNTQVGTRVRCVR